VNQDVIQKVYKRFSPSRPLEAEDPLYVDCDGERHTLGFREILADEIRKSHAPTCQLLSGGRGCGKTTDLFRLRHQLVTGEPAYFVVYCASDEFIALSDVEYVDVLLAIFQQLTRDADKLGIRPDTSKLAGLLKDIEVYLTRSRRHSGFEGNPGIAGLELDLKHNPQNRHLVRQHLRKRGEQLLEAINETIRRVETVLRRQEGYAGLVIIVDNLDRVYRQPAGNSERSSQDVLFVDGARYLRNLGPHVLYIIPPALLCSASGSSIPDLYHTQPQRIPMIPVSTRWDGTDSAGLEILEKVIARRLRQAGATLSEAFDSATSRQRLCAVSGGQFDRLMSSMQRSMNYEAALPITRKSLEQVVRDGRDEVTRAVRSTGQRNRLRELAATKEIGTTDYDLLFLDSGLVLEYRDESGPWFDVNPLVRESLGIRQ